GGGTGRHPRRRLLRNLRERRAGGTYERPVELGRREGAVRPAPSVERSREPQYGCNPAVLGRDDMNDGQRVSVCEPDLRKIRQPPARLRGPPPSLARISGLVGGSQRAERLENA